MKAKELVQQLCEAGQEGAQDIVFRVVCFNLNDYPDYGRGEGPSIGEVQGKDKTIWRKFNAFLQQHPQVKLKDLHVEFHDEVENDWCCYLQGKVTGPSSELTFLNKVGNAGIKGDELWYLEK